MTERDVLPYAKRPVEDAESWEGHLSRLLADSEDSLDSSAASYESESEPSPAAHRRLHRGHNHRLTDAEREWISERERRDEMAEEEEREREERKKEKRGRKNRKHRAEMLESSGVREDTVHGMMIDAGSTGSRMHVYEFEPRVLRSDREVRGAVSGKRLSYPGTETRWTERLSPGLGTFAYLSDEDLLPAVAEYLSPLVEFASDVLHTKSDRFHTFPIYLKATAGLRILSPRDRSRVMGAVRALFSNSTYCPFSFEDERARVISGEEEAIYGWAGVNWLMGTLIEDSEGAGTVIEPRLTYGALDMGGASTQISFYEPGGDVMSNLFKLQIGQGKHWNVYAHSFLRYGINAAVERMGARLASDRSVKERLVDGVYDPCLPGGSRMEFRSSIQFDENGIETAADGAGEPLETYSATLINDGGGGDWDACLGLAVSMLHLEADAWCDFSHGGDCSFAGVYQPPLPIQSDRFGEFLGFSNYNHIWEFLKLPARSSLSELRDRAGEVCSMGREELLAFNNGTVDDDTAAEYCTRSAYAFAVLHRGYGFPLDYHITATSVVDGHKVDWALGAMLYEINTLPWRYVGGHQRSIVDYADGAAGAGAGAGIAACFLTAVVVVAAAILVRLFWMRSHRRPVRVRYEPIKEVEIDYGGI